MKLTGIVIGGVLVAAAAFSPYLVAAVDSVSNEAVSEQLARLLDPESYPEADPELLKEWLSALPAGQVALLMFILWYRNFLGPPLRRLIMLLLAEWMRARKLETHLEVLRGHDEAVSDPKSDPDHPKSRRRSLDELRAEYATPRRHF